MDNSLLSAPPNGNASFSLNITKPLDIAPGELVRLIASIRVEEVGAPSPQVGLLLRRDLTGSTLQMIMDQKTIYDKELETTAGKFKEVESEKTMSSDNPKLEIIQESGAKPVDVTIRGIRLAEAKSLATPGEATQTESANGGQETKAPGATGKGGRSGSVPILESKTRIGPGTAPGSVPGTAFATASGTAFATASGTAFATASGTAFATASGTAFATASGTFTSIGTGTSTGTAAPTSSGPAEIIPNEGGHGHMVNKVQLYVVPLIAAFLL
ncbi:hypothetical protein AUP68_09346 [Ilyonectria robusta]